MVELLLIWNQWLVEISFMEIFVHSCINAKHTLIILVLVLAYLLSIVLRCSGSMAFWPLVCVSAEDSFGKENADNFKLPAW